MLGSKKLSNLGRTFFQCTKRFFASQAEIEEKLRKNLKVSELEVFDTSGNCGTAFVVKVVAEDFQGKTPIQQHRLVNEILKEDLKDVHAMQLKTEAPKHSRE